MVWSKTALTPLSYQAPKGSNFGKSVFFKETVCSYDWLACYSMSDQHTMQ